MQWMGEIELDMEIHKQKLVTECQEYNTIDAFRLIDQDGQGAVSQDEILLFLDNNFGDQIEYDYAEIELFMIRFDKQEKQKVKYSEFCTAFAPQSSRAQQVLA